MPVIVYKTLTIELFYAQCRRIFCEHCQRPFCYITGGVESAQTTGAPLISSSDRMRDSAVNQAIGSLHKTAKKRNAGEAMCPHCQSYQRWMVTHSHLSNMGCFCVLGLVLWAIAAAVVNAIFQLASYLLVVGSSVIVGATLGLIIGKLLAITIGPHVGHEEPRAMTDEQLRNFIERCHGQDAEPFLLWWISLGNEPGEKQGVVTLGIEDQTGKPIFPADMSTDQVLANVR